MSSNKPNDKCGYVENGSSFLSYCCWRESLPDTNHCVWHAVPEETNHKTIENLQEYCDKRKIFKQITSPGAKDEFIENFNHAVLTDMELGDRISFADTCLWSADLSGANLKGADLSGAHLWHADLSGANLKGADLSRANLRHADLSGANLQDADLLGAKMAVPIRPKTDLSNANLVGANLETSLNGVNLRCADLSGAKLRGAGLARADVSKIKIEQPIEIDAETRVSSSVTFTWWSRWLKSITLTPHPFGFCDDAEDWHELAKGYQRLRIQFKEAGLNRQHKALYTYQRRAREKHVRELGPEWSVIPELLSRYLTGYGTRVHNVLFWTAIMILLPALWYRLISILVSEPFHGGPLYYSIVTFVSSPPALPPTHLDPIESVTRIIVLSQTYFGTALVILLGYVLGNKDPI